MTAAIIGVIVLSSLAWSLFDTSRKKLAAQVAPEPVMTWLSILQAPVFLVVGLFILSESWIIPPSSYWVPAIASIVVNSLANLWFIEAVALAPLSLAIPVLSLTPVFSTIGAFFALDERINLQQAGGIAIIVFATFVLGRLGSREHIGDLGKAVRRGLVLMALVAVLFAVTPVFDKMGLRAVPLGQHGFMQNVVIAILFAFYLRFKKLNAPTAMVKANLKWFSIAVLFASLALFTQLWAIQSIPVGIFEALKRSMGLVSALTLGYFLFNEKISKAKVGLVGLIAVGIFVLLV